MIRVTSPKPGMSKFITNLRVILCHPRIGGCYSYYTNLGIIRCRSGIRGCYSYYGEVSRNSVIPGADYFRIVRNSCYHKIEGCCSYYIRTYHKLCCFRIRGCYSYYAEIGRNHVILNPKMERVSSIHA